jgi:hypothetical protein
LKEVSQGFLLAIGEAEKIHGDVRAGDLNDPSDGKKGAP